MTEDEVQTEARTLARAAGFDPDEIVEAEEAEPVIEDRGDGVPVVEMRHPLRPRWALFEDQARAKLEGGAESPGAA
jgi:hypothetical protein